jgi:flavodoxin
MKRPDDDDGDDLHTIVSTFKRKANLQTPSDGMSEQASKLASEKAKQRKTWANRLHTYRVFGIK